MASLIIGIMLMVANYTGPMRSTPVAVNGGWQLQITGEMVDVTAVCSHMDCAQVFPTPIDAANAYVKAWGEVNGFPVAPIPPGS